MSERVDRLKVIIDANVLISWAIATPDSQSASCRVTNWAFSGTGRLLVPERLVYEVKTVVERPIMSRRISSDRKERLITVLEFLATDMDAPSAVTAQPVRDKKDQYLLDAAFAFEVDALITGDRDLLVLANHDNLGWIVTAAEFASKHLDEAPLR